MKKPKRNEVREEECTFITEMMKREVGLCTHRWVPETGCTSCAALVSIAKRFKLDFDKLVQEVRG